MPGVLLKSLLYTALLGLTVPQTSAWPHHRTFRVKSGGSIQSAIDFARRGDRIVVEAGTYAEQLTITTSGLTLIGQNAIIIPPSSPVTNTCSDLAGPGTQAGICVSGSDIELQDLKDFDGEHRKVNNVGKHIKDTSITGFTVQNFGGLNIAIVGGQDTDVWENSVSSSSQYGILTVGSRNSNIKRNTVSSVGPTGPFPFYFIGICMDDTSTVTISHNDISGYFIGLCVQTAYADIHDNNVHDICVGAFVDPNIKGARLEGNSFSNTLPGCPATPNFSSGITISGGKGTIVKGNTFTGIKNGGQAAGVVIVDDNQTKAVAEGNVIERNVFSGNDLDILVQATGKGNVVKRNQCSTSNPAGLCK
ncbi:hypothetical protein TWF281_011367 [Arthrobotrys megalospora]